MKNYNPDIIFVRTYGNYLIPLSKVQLVTVDPNNGNVVQEMPLEFCIKKLMHHNMHDYDDVKDSWKNLDNYSMLEKK